MARRLLLRKQFTIIQMILLLFLSATYLSAAHVLTHPSTPVWPEFRYSLNSDGRSERAGPWAQPSLFVDTSIVRGIGWMSGLLADEFGVYGVSESDRFFAVDSANGENRLRCNVSLNSADSILSNHTDMDSCRETSVGLNYSTRRVQSSLALMSDRLAVAITLRGQMTLVNTATCTLEWSSNTNVYSPCSPPTMSNDRTVYVVGGNRSSIHALKLTSDNSSLEEVWREDLVGITVPAQHASSSVAVASDTGTLYVASVKDRLASISIANDTRKLTQTVLADCAPALSASPAVWVCAEGSLSASLGNNTSQFVYNCSGNNIGLVYVSCERGMMAVNRLNDEAQAWTSVFQECTVRSSPAVLLIKETPVVVIGCTQVGNETSQVLLKALDGIMGELLWQLNLPGSGVVASPNADVNGVVYISTHSPAYVCAVNGTSGRLLWSQLVQGEIVPSPIIGADSNLLMFVPGCGLASSSPPVGGNNMTCTSHSVTATPTTSNFTPSSTSSSASSRAPYTQHPTQPSGYDSGYSSKMLAVIIVSSVVGAVLFITVIFCTFIKYQERRRRGRYVYSTVQDDDVWNTS